MIWNKSYWTEDEQLLFWKAASSGYLLYEKITKSNLELVPFITEFSISVYTEALNKLVMCSSILTIVLTVLRHCFK